jgi:hypothetical protein
MPGTDEVRGPGGDEGSEAAAAQGAKGFGGAALPPWAAAGTVPAEGAAREWVSLATADMAVASGEGRGAGDDAAVADSVFSSLGGGTLSLAEELPAGDMGGATTAADWVFMGA